MAPPIRSVATPRAAAALRPSGGTRPASGPSAAADQAMAASAMVAGSQTADIATTGRRVAVSSRTTGPWRGNAPPRTARPAATRRRPTIAPVVSGTSAAVLPAAATVGQRTPRAASAPPAAASLSQPAPGAPSIVRPRRQRRQERGRGRDDDHRRSRAGETDRREIGFLARGRHGREECERDRRQPGKEAGQQRGEAGVRGGRSTGEECGGDRHARNRAARGDDRQARVRRRCERQADDRGGGQRVEPRRHRDRRSKPGEPNGC